MPTAVDSVPRPVKPPIPVVGNTYRDAVAVRVARIPPEANASVNTSRLIVTYLAAERSMPPFLPGSPALPPESR